MKRNNRYIFKIALIMLVFPMACKESFLDQDNTFQSNADALSTKKEAVIGLVNGIYDTYQNSDLLKKCIWYRANFGTHDFFNWGGDVFWNNYQIPSTFGGLSTLWNQSYIGIARANSAFTTITKAQTKGVIDASLANRLKGEAYFLRGLTYYYLASCFGGVPLEVDTSGALNLGLRPRSPRDSVYMQVVADMKKAETLLWSKKDLPKADLGRATKGAAFAYEGAAQMWLKNYPAALAAFNSQELSSNYALLKKFADVHEYDNQNNNESLFEIQFEVKSGDPQDWGGSWNPPGGEIAWIDSFSWPEEITQQGYDYGNPALWNSFQEGDQRKLLTIVGPGDTIASPGIIKAWGGIKGYIPVKDGFAGGNKKYTADDGSILNTCGTQTRPWYGSDNGRTGYYCSKKWRDYNLTGGYGPQKIFGDQNQILMRYAEVLLSRAECKIRTNDIAGAMADLKTVRDRAWGGIAPAVMKDSANFDGTPGQPITDPLQMVLSEYRHELAGEYSLFFNLCRAGTDVAIAFIKKANGTVDGSYEPVVNPAPGPTHDGKKHGLYNTTLTPEKTLLPIPQVAISLNPNLTPNP
ncbi:MULTISPECIES: RagB/SusD family nutrient uptake outer membrane protein [Niastella]|uniref:RagB/SusD family nutrient uptake outer membrane protein n=1 Tax=Niastella soli TaxID=2821487 RepID=A0ABS3YVX5_9BACT|nr:RagB/SusD family nutrient uptake outer membrane protein [Niastella soli]MBO9202081.1 RagB/SusD family nutrient uptake outer membrane protein [Niastella soli]